MMLYFIIGTVFTMLIDLAIIYTEEKRFNNLERIVCIILWPFAIANFIHGYLKSLFKDK